MDVDPIGILITLPPGALAPKFGLSTNMSWKRRRYGVGLDHATILEGFVNSSCTAVCWIWNFAKYPWGQIAFRVPQPSQNRGFLRGRRIDNNYVGVSAGCFTQQIASKVTA